MIKKFEKKNWFYSYDIIFDLELSEHAKLTYLYLCRCADNDSKSFPSYNTIANKCSFSRTTAIRSIKELEDIKLLYKQERLKVINGKTCNTSNLYYVFPSPYEDNDIDEIEEDSNIIIVQKSTLPPSISQTLPLVSHRHHPSISDTPKGLPKEVQHNISTSSSSVPSLVDDDMLCVINHFKECITNKVTQHHKKVIKELVATYGKDKVMAAITTTGETASKPNMNYVRKCCINGIKVTHKKQDKSFTNMYSHEWDLDELEDLASTCWHEGDTL